MTEESEIDDVDEIWALAEFLSQEARLMRSLLEYLRLSDIPDTEKMEMVQNWRSGVGAQLGSPSAEDTDLALQTFREMKPNWRGKGLKLLREQLQGHYLPQQG